MANFRNFKCEKIFYEKAFQVHQSNLELNYPLWNILKHFQPTYHKLVIILQLSITDSIQMSFEWFSSNLSQHHTILYTFIVISLPWKCLETPQLTSPHLITFTFVRMSINGLKPCRSFNGVVYKNGNYP